MEYTPFRRMKNKIAASKAESDLGYFYDLLLFGEFLTKSIALYLVATINEDNERTQYRFQHTLVRANAIGDFSKTIEDIVNGPAAQLLTSDIRDFELKELTQRSKSGDWQYESQVLLIECLSVFNIEHNTLPTKSPLRNWFLHFTHLRNKTKGHGAPKTECCTEACPKLEKAIELIIDNFSAFKRPWAHLYRNLSGKYRVSNISEDLNGFESLKSTRDQTYTNGIYVYLDKPRHVKLYYTNTELTDFWITNGNLSKDTFETISYVSDERVKQSANDYLMPITKLPSSHTEGLPELEIMGKCLTNLPKSPDYYINRNTLEKELEDTLMQEDRFPIITLLGKGGVGKTSLALNSITKIAESNRFELIIWFSARDIDLLIDGPKQVQTKVLNINDIAKDYCSLMHPEASKKDIEQMFSDDLTSNSFGKSLYVFDNFETITNPIEVFEWINTYVRNPNKVLITSRISRNFKADYPIEVQGMTYEECRDLIGETSRNLKINHLTSIDYIDELIEESDGHPYIIKILLGEVARQGKANKIKRVVAEQEKILSALFKRTFGTLSPSAKRTFLTLCSWNSMVPMIALEAVLWRPENEKMDVQKSIEELRQSSFIDVSTREGDELINVPLAANIFGKGELEIYPEKIKILSDRALLMEFGTTTYSNLSSGLAKNIERKFTAISKRINSIIEFNSELPVLEYIGSKYPKTYQYIVDVFEEYEDYGQVKYYLREYLKCNLIVSDKVSLWMKLADVCKYTNDWDGESHSLTELVQLPGIGLQQISDAANRINNHIFYDLVAKQDEYKTEMLSIVIIALKSRLINGNATDYSRLGWLLLNDNNSEEAIEVVKKGLVIDPENTYCQRLLSRLEKTTS
jgi:tetratricopeptide (TPR) repeat protein